MSKILIMILMPILGFATPCPPNLRVPNPSSLLTPISDFVTKPKRQPVKATSNLYKAIGRIRTGKERCTGFLVRNSRTVMTSAHCFYKQDKLISSTTFEIDINGKTYTGHVGHTGTTYPNATAAELAKDWAILVLDEPVNGVEPLKLAAATLDEFKGAKVEMPGFSGVDKGALSTVKDCTVDFEVEGRFGHSCASFKGNSGAPLMIDTNKGPRVAAIHASSGFALNEEDDETNRNLEFNSGNANYAVPITREISDKLNEVIQENHL